VGRLAPYGVSSALAWIAAAATVSAAPPGPGPAPRSPQVMLYFSHFVGGGAGGRPTFGLKVDQVRQASNLGDPEAGDAWQHRELINWQLQAHSNLRITDLRVRLGNRVTYDLTNRAFGSPATHRTVQIGVPGLRNASAGPVGTRGPATIGSSQLKIEPTTKLKVDRGY